MTKNAEAEKNTSQSAYPHLKNVWTLFLALFEDKESLVQFDQYILNLVSKRKAGMSKNVPDLWWYQTAWEYCNSQTLLLHKPLNPSDSLSTAQTWEKLPWTSRWFFVWTQVFKFPPDNLKQVNFWSDEFIEKAQVQISSIPTDILESIHHKLNNLFENQPLPKNSLLPLSEKYSTDYSETFYYKFNQKKIKGRKVLGLISWVLLGFISIFLAFHFFLKNNPAHSQISNFQDKSSLKVSPSNIIPIHWQPQIAIDSSWIHTYFSQMSQEMVSGSDTLDSKKMNQKVSSFQLKLKSGFYPIFISFLREKGVFLSEPALASTHKEVRIQLYIHEPSVN